MRTRFALPFKRHHLFAVVALALALPAFADYPQYLNIGGDLVAGYLTYDYSNQPCYEYDSTQGVVVLRTSNGGAYGGSDLNSIFDGLGSVGYWDGTSSIHLPGYNVTVPSLILYGSDFGFPTLIGSGTYDAPLAVAYINDRWVAAYQGVHDGSVFAFSINDGVRYYRYQPGSGQTIFDARSEWPPSNIASLPSSATIYNFTLPALPLDSTTSSTVGESLDSNGYSAYCNYSSWNVSAVVHLSVSPEGTTYGNWSASGPGFSVGGEWDLTTGAGLFSAPASSPQFGPYAISAYGAILIFRLHDASGADFYSDNEGWNQVWINAGNAVTSTTQSNGSDSGAYDPTTQSFTLSHTALGTLSADGESLVGVPPGVTVITDQSELSPLNSGSWFATHPADYILHRSDGTTLFKYTSLPATEYFSIADSPIYAYNGGEVALTYMATMWSASNLPVPPPTISVNGKTYRCSGTSIGGSPDTFWSYSWYLVDGYPTPSYSALISFGISNGNSWQYAYFQTAQGTFSGQVDPATLACSGFPAESSRSLTLSFTSTPPTPAYGPAAVTVVGQTLSYAGLDSIGRDTYFSSTSDLELTIDNTGYVTLSAHSSWGGYALGQYHSDSETFTFPSYSVFCVPLGANGIPIGLPPGLALYFGADGFAPSITLGNGAVLNTTNTTTLRFLRSSSLTWGVKYLGLTEGSLFVVADTDNSYSSSIIYRYHSNGADDVIDASSLAWPPSNLFPSKIYVNGKCANLSLTSPSLHASGIPQTSYATYRIHTSQELVTINYTWNDSFSATVSGSYDSFGSFHDGSWDGWKFFSGLPDGLVITLDPLPANPHIGPPKIQWDGVEFTFDPIASAVSGSNPTGRDIYRNALGLSLSVAIADNGTGGTTVTLTRADGAQIYGTYDPVTGTFNITGNAAGNLTATNNDGTTYDPSGTNSAAGGTLGAASEITNILGSLDVHGDSFTLGTWNSQGSATNGFGLTFSNASGDQPAVLDFSAVRPTTDWTWSHSTDGGSQHATAMRVDANHRLILYDPANPNTASIIIDPSGKSHIEPQGDLSMGDYTATP